MSRPPPTAKRLLADASSLATEVASLTLPTFTSPYPSRVSSHLAAANERSLAWAAGTGLAVPGTRRYARLERGRFAALAAHTWPHAGEDDLVLATNWCTWLFVRDDICDNPRYFDESDNGDAVVHADTFENLLRGRGGAEQSVVHLALADILSQISVRGGPRWTARFALAVRNYLQATEWEIDNRTRQIVPGVGVYIKMRRFAGATRTAFAVAGAIRDVDPEAPFLDDAYVETLSQLADHDICWTNDVEGLAKEIAEGNPNNLVLALRAERGVDLAAAVKEAHDMRDVELSQFVELEQRLPSAGSADLDDQRERYLDGLRSWMRGNMDWYRETGRYRKGA